MRKTKIVCTMGPSTDKPGILRQLLENGMDVARFNFSHGDYEEHKGRLDAMRALNERKIPREWLAGPQQNVTPKIEQSNVTNNYYATYNFPSITPIEVKQTRALTKTAQLGTM